MNRHGSFWMIWALLAGVSVASAQEPTPKPVPPAPVVAPIAPIPPLSPFWKDDIDEALDKVRALEKMKAKTETWPVDVDTILDNAKLAAMNAKQALGAFNLNGLAFLPQGFKGRAGRLDGGDRDYERGQ